MALLPGKQYALRLVRREGRTVSGGASGAILELHLYSERKAHKNQNRLTCHKITSLDTTCNQLHSRFLRLRSRYTGPVSSQLYVRFMRTRVGNLCPAGMQARAGCSEPEKWAEQEIRLYLQCLPICICKAGHGMHRSWVPPRHVRFGSSKSSTFEEAGGSSIPHSHVLRDTSQLTISVQVLSCHLLPSSACSLLHRSTHCL